MKKPILVSSLLLLSLTGCYSPTNVKTEDKVKEAAKDLLNNVEPISNLKASSKDLNLLVETQAGNATYTINRFNLEKASFNTVYKNNDIYTSNPYSCYGNIDGNFTLFETKINRLNKEVIYEDSSSIKLNEEFALLDNNVYTHVSNDVLNYIDSSSLIKEDNLYLMVNDVNSFISGVASSYIGNESINIDANSQFLSQIININPNDILSDFLDDNKPYSPYLSYDVIDEKKYNISLDLDKSNISSLIETYAGNNASVINNNIEFSNNTSLHLGVNFSKELVDSLDVNFDISFTYLAKFYKTNINLNTSIDFSKEIENEKMIDLTKEYKTFEDLGIDVQALLKDQIDKYLPLVDIVTGIIKEF